MRACEKGMRRPNLVSTQAIDVKSIVATHSAIRGRDHSNCEIRQDIFCRPIAGFAAIERECNDPVGKGDLPLQWLMYRPRPFLCLASFAVTDLVVLFAFTLK